MFLVTTTEAYEPFLTEWFDPDNFNNHIGMVVYNLSNRTYTTDGLNWSPIKVDSL